MDQNDLLSRVFPTRRAALESSRNRESFIIYEQVEPPESVDSEIAPEEVVPIIQRLVELKNLGDRWKFCIKPV